MGDVRVGACTGAGPRQIGARLGRVSFVDDDGVSGSQSFAEDAVEDGKGVAGRGRHDDPRGTDGAVMVLRVLSQDMARPRSVNVAAHTRPRSRWGQRVVWANAPPPRTVWGRTRGTSAGSACWPGGCRAGFAGGVHQPAHDYQEEAFQVAPDRHTEQESEGAVGEGDDRVPGQDRRPLPQRRTPKREQYQRGVQRDHDADDRDRQGLGGDEPARAVSGGIPAACRTRASCGRRRTP